MADVVKTSGTLQIVAEFVDEDDRSITLDNPKATITAAEVNALSSFIKTNGILIGDKDGADFSRVKSAKKIQSTVKYLDLDS